MNSKPGDAARRTLKGITQPTPECISVDRFGEGLTSVERDHIVGCARCQTETALWNTLDDSAPRPDEGAAVQWIVKELRRRHQTPAAAAVAAGSGPWRSWRLVSAIGATIALVSDRRICHSRPRTGGLRNRRGQCGTIGVPNSSCVPRSAISPPSPSARMDGFPRRGRVRRLHSRS